MRPHQLLWTVCLCCAACGSETNALRVPNVIDASSADAAGWRLVWSDEFDAPADAPIDASKWRHDVGGEGWGNGQLEFDTDRVENVRHDGEGNLIITARREAYQGRDYTSARIKTQGLFEQRYGRIEARIQLPRGKGMWPAFWMLGGDIDEVGWPECGEIDVMEYRGQLPSVSTGAIHGPGHSASASLHGAREAGEDLPDGFHLFAVEWSEDAIVWRVDGERFFEVHRRELTGAQRWVYDHDFFLLLNLAVGGDYVGPPDAATVFPQRMRVDYVRVYEREA